MCFKTDYCYYYQYCEYPPFMPSVTSGYSTDRCLANDYCCMSDLSSLFQQIIMPCAAIINSQYHCCTCAMRLIRCYITLASVHIIADAVVGKLGYQESSSSLLSRIKSISIKFATMLLFTSSIFFFCATLCMCSYSPNDEFI